MMRETIPQNVVDAHIRRGVSLARAWREHLGMTQDEVARRAGITQSALAQLEASNRRPRKATLEKLAAALGITVDALLA